MTTIKVKELIEMLKVSDPEADVILSFEDYCHDLHVKCVAFEDLGEDVILNGWGHDEQVKKETGICVVDKEVG